MKEDPPLEQLKKAITAQNNDRINDLITNELIAQIEIANLDTLLNLKNLCIGLLNRVPKRLYINSLKKTPELM